MEKFSIFKKKKKKNGRTGSFLVEELIALLLAAFSIKMRFVQGTVCAKCLLAGLGSGTEWEGNGSAGRREFADRKASSENISC